MRNTLLITIELDKLPLPIRNEIMVKIKNSNKRFSLENQQLKVDLNTLKLLEETLAKVK